MPTPYTLIYSTHNGDDAPQNCSTLLFTSALEEGEGSASRPRRTLPPGETRYPFYRRLDGPQGRSGQVRTISPPLGFDPRTVQPVGSRYTDYATQPTLLFYYRVQNAFFLGYKNLSVTVVYKK